MREIPEKPPKKIPEKPPVLKPVQWVLIKGRITNTKGRGISGLTIRILGLKGHALPNPVELKKIVTEKDGRFKIKISADSLNALIKSTRARSLHIYFEILDTRKRKLFDTKDCVEGIWDGDSFQIKRYPKSMACKKLAKLLEGLNIRLADFEAFVGSELEPEPAKPVLLLPMRLEIRKNDQSFKIRWYPDDIHVPIPIGKITEEEWNAFTEIFNGSNFDECATQLQEAFGVIRARQLVKFFHLNSEFSPDGAWNFDIDKDTTDPLEIFLENGVQIKTLPRKIYLYTIKAGTVNCVLSKIIKNHLIDINPESATFETDNWMTNFDIALNLGMGVEISQKITPNQYFMIKDADWLFIIGINDNETAHQHLEEIFKRRNAAGQLAILPQDSPTNNTTVSTPYTDLETDIRKYFRATDTSIPVNEIPDESQSRIDNETLTTDAKLLSDMFGFHPTTLGEIPGAQLQEQDEAAAISLLLSDICTNIYRATWSKTGVSLPVTWESFQHFFVEHVRARGNFPIIRFDDIPYGILPVISMKEWEPRVSSESEHLHYNVTLSIVHNLISIINTHFLELSKDLTRLEPYKEANSFEKLLEILRSNRVSNSVENLVSELRMADLDWENLTSAMKDQNPNYTACQLVKSNDTEITINEYNYNSPIAYLQLLANTSETLEEIWPILAQRININTPILERIIFYLLLRIKNPGEFFPTISVSFSAIQKAAKILANIHPDKVELLLMEIFDLLSYRVDAISTGLAHDQLYNGYLNNGEIPQVGIFGWLETSGEFPDTEISIAEYIQTPWDQANTAALLRNASINCAEGEDAFNINLSSSQTKKGLWYLEALRQNRLIGEVLGAQIERLIHDEKENSPHIEEIDIYKLRREFPLPLQKAIGSSNATDEADDRTFVETIINGEDFLEADLSTIFTGTKLQVYQAIQRKVHQTKDAAADIALSEILYQHMKGNVDRAAAWLDFLDGEVIPPEPEFIRTPRTGNQHATRVYLVIEPPTNNDEILPNGDIDLPGYSTFRKFFPRQMISPIINHFCNNILGDFATTDLQISFSKSDESSDQILIQVNPRTDLQFEAIDLLIGGESELRVKIKYFLLNLWKSNDSAFSTFGEYPIELPIGKQFNLLKIEYSLNPLHSRKVKLLREVLNATKQDSGIISAEPDDDLKLISPDDLEGVDFTQIILILENRILVLFTRLQEIELFFKSLNSYFLFLKPLKELIVSLANQVTAPLDFNKQNWTNIAKVLDQLNVMSTTFVTACENQFGTDTLGADIHFVDKLTFLSNDHDPSDPLYQANLDEIKSDLNSLISNISSIVTIDAFLKPLKKLLSLLENKGAEVLNYDRERLISLAKLLDIQKDASSQFNTIYSNNFGDITTFVKLISELSNLDWNSSEYTNTFDNINNYLHIFILAFENLVDILCQNQLKEYLLEASRYGYTKGLAPLPPSLVTSKVFTDMLSELLLFIKEKIKKMTTSLDNFHSNPQENFQQRLSRIITILQEATDGKSTLILTPFIKEGVEGWQIDFSNFTDFSQTNWKLGNFAKVRKNLKNIEEFLTFNDDFKVYVDQYHRQPEQPTDPDDGSIKYGTTDFCYITTMNGLLNAKCFCCILIDDWWEFFPNMTETTAITYRYDAPQAEAPNAILLAVPPKINDENGWGSNLEVLAQTVKETIDLIKIRMVGPSQIASSNLYSNVLPAILFFSYLPQQPFFPYVPKPIPRDEDAPFFSLEPSLSLPNMIGIVSSTGITDSQFVFANSEWLPDYLQNALNYMGDQAKRTHDPQIGEEENE